MPRYKMCVPTKSISEFVIEADSPLEAAKRILAGDGELVGDECDGYAFGELHEFEVLENGKVVAEFSSKSLGY